MDEPFVALDAQSRLTMQQLLMDIWQELEMTIIFVTHDVEEALFLSDRIFILDQRPSSVAHEIMVPYHRPRSVELIASYEFSQLKGAILKRMFH